MKPLSPRKFNLYLIAKLPTAFIAGVRVKKIEENKAITHVKYRWINTNPFKSMYFAVQSMAAELSTGVLVVGKTASKTRKFSMLITAHQGSFYKKATGKITFTCQDGHLIDEAIKKALETNLPQTIELKSIGKNEEGVPVSEYLFTWSIKPK